jgi:hypothetical protein
MIDHGSSNVALAQKIRDRHVSSTICTLDFISLIIATRYEKIGEDIAYRKQS